MHKESVFQVIRTIVYLILAIGIAEFLVMQFLPWLETLLPTWPEAALGAMVLSITMAPIIYLIIRPKIVTDRANEQSIHFKLLISSALPLLVSILLMLNIIQQKQEDAQQLTATKATIEFDIQLAKVIDLAKAELELSALALANNTKNYGEIIEQRKLVDNGLNALKSVLVNNNVEQARLSLADIEDYIKGQNVIRNRIDSQTIQWFDVLKFHIQSKNKIFAALSSFTQTTTGDQYVEELHNDFLTLIKIKMLNNVTSAILHVTHAASVKNSQNNDEINYFKQVLRTQISLEAFFFESFLTSMKGGEKNELLVPLESELMREIFELEQEFLAREEELQLKKVNKIIGYNGLIHQFKNYLLRGDKKYFDQFMVHYKALKGILPILRQLKIQDQDSLDKLFIFESVMDSYYSNLLKISSYRAQGKSAEEIDQFIVIDDSPAQSSLEYLLRNAWEYEPEYMLSLITQKINQILDVERQVANSLENSLDNALADKLNEKSAVSAIALILLVLITSLIIIINRNVSESYEQRLIALNKAEDGARMKAEFLANMSHEIRTPMNGVIGMLDLLQHSSLSNEQAHRVDVAKSSADSLLSLINDILDFSKVDAGKLTIESIEFNLRDLVGDLVEALAIQAQGKGIELICNLANVEESLIYSDPSRIRQILTNLIGNAIKFTDQGEVIVEIDLKVDENNAQQRILTGRVIDTGIGIALDKHEQLFAAFNQEDASTTRKYGGTGLGLSITKKLCQLMGGDISLTNGTEPGSCFEFSIIVGSSANAQKVKPQSNVDDLHFILIEENESLRTSLVEQFERWQVNIYAVASVEDALQRMESNQAKYTVMVDVKLLKATDTKVQQSFKSIVEANASRLVLLAPISENIDEDSLQYFSFDSVVLKPLTTAELLEIIDFSHQRKVIKGSGEQEEALNEYVLATGAVNVLLVEDNRVNQMVALGVLKKLGLSAEVAENGLQAIEKLKNTVNETPYSVVIMDCQMPEMDGYEASQRIRAGDAGDTYKEVPIIAMTANAMHGDREKCLSAGMNDYLTKPISAKLLLEKLTLWLQ